MSLLSSELEQCAISGCPLTFSYLLHQHLQDQPFLLRHRGIKLDCFHLVSHWLSNTSLHFDPAYLFKELIPWSLPQFFALCGTYYFYKHHLDKSRLFFLASLRISCGYQPSHYYLFLLNHSLDSLNISWRCHKPFSTLDIQYLSATPCCNSWLPYPVSNPSCDTPHETWHGNRISTIRESINNGTYVYCNPSFCPQLRNAIVNPTLPNSTSIVAYASPKYIQLSYDRSCNLACPSCRTSFFSASSKDIDDYSRLQKLFIEPLLKNSKSILSITYSGDPFASKHYRNLLTTLLEPRFSEVYLIFVTNGLLLTSTTWRQYKQLWHRVVAISISVDAATPTTYSKLRPPGKWDELITNLQALVSWRASTKASAKLILNFCVQHSNFHEMEQFFNLASDLGFDQVYYQRFLNWGQFKTSDLIQLDVGHVLNPDYHQFSVILERIRFISQTRLSPSIRLGVFD